MEHSESDDLPIVCDLTTIPADQREAHQSLTERLFSSAQSREELADGYTFRFAAEQYDFLTAFIANERRCCPFIKFTLDVYPASGPILLRMTGKAGVKELLAAEFQLT